jgi:hypothetical protein
MKKRIIFGVWLIIAVLLMLRPAQARYLNVNTGRFQTMDTYEGDQQDPRSLHKYLYAEGNPINGIDPSGDDDIGDLMVAMDISVSLDAMPNLVTVGEAMTPLSSGTWHIFEDTVPITYGNVYTIKDRNDHGFQVQYNPSGGGESGSVALYQTIAESGFMSHSAPHVDVGSSPINTAAKERAATGCGLPPAIHDPAGSAYSYWDSPTSTSLFHVIWDVTAVAVRRSGCNDTPLSTYYFEFDNNSRKITKMDIGYRDNYDAAMQAWNQ